jgi:hypothetical protein
VFRINLLILIQSKIDLFFILTINIKMTTTDSFQKVSDFFTSKVDIKPVQTNPRYPNYNQTHFTAGDIEQFEMYRDRSNGLNPTKKIDLESNRWEVFNKEEIVGEHLDWKKYSNITTNAIDQTFLYIFEKFKKGVFIKIKDNQLSVFLPFSKHNYTNEWSQQIKFPPMIIDEKGQQKQVRDMTEFLIFASKLQGYNIKPEQVNSHINKWYANNCLIRSEYPTGENDRCVSNLKDLLLTLCKERSVPDIELFFNRRDFPLIKKDDTEPYEHIYNSEKMPLSSHRYDKYCPILSMVTTNQHTDIPFPTMEDWARVESQEDGKLFYPDFKDYKIEFNMNWESKKPTAVFRGASTGCGVTVNDNPRLYLASLKSPIENGEPLIDAGITKWNCRPRKIMKHDYLEVIHPKLLNISLSSFITPKEQSNYKYIINVDGHVSAFRLSLELSTGSVVLLQDSKYRVWFRKYLKEYVHYVPIKEDLSNLYEQIRWCRNHDAECKEIAKNALEFYKMYLTKDGILDYTQLLFCNIKKVTGTYYYNYISIQDILYKKQFEMLENKISPNPEHFNFPLSFLNINGMNGFEIYLRKHDIPEKLTNKKDKHETKDTIITTYNLDSLELSIKKSKRNTIINEAFIGIFCINKLLREIPNFRYTFGLKDQNLIFEYIQGITFSEYIKKCSFDDFIAILKIIFLTLSVAQQHYGFVHNDLCPWNIIIKTYPTKQHVVYSFKDQIYTVDSFVLPILIDYDKSHVIYEEFHYGIIHPFKSSTFQDCFSIIINSIYEFCLRKINPYESSILLYIINFLTNTDFHSLKITNMKDLLDFLQTNKKYNELVYKNKCELEQLTPFDFLAHFENENIKLSESISIQNIDGKKVKKDNLYINPLFYYDMIISKNNHQDILNYLDKIENQVIHKLDQFLLNYIYYVHSCNQIYEILINLLDFIETYKNLKSSDEYFIQKRNCQRILTRISTQMHYKNINQDSPVCGHYLETIETKDPELLFCKICKTNVNKQKINYKIYLSPTYQSNFSIAKYNLNTFSVQSSILTQLQGNTVLRNEKYLNIWYMIRDCILFEKQFTLKNEADLLKHGTILYCISPLSILNHNANIKTLKYISKEIYTVDQNFLSQLPETPLKTLNTIKNILALCK